MQSNKTGIIFDLDGTLWDSSRQVVDSWNIGLTKYPEIPYKITVQDMHDNMGKLMPEIANNLIKEVSDEKRAEILEHLCRVENDYIRKAGGELFQGIEELVQKLGRKYKLFIVSNCQAGYIEAFLDYYRFNAYFSDHLCPGDTGKKKDENIKIIMKRNDISQAIYVGDTYGDYYASHVVAGLPFIHAAYGYGTVEEAEYSVNEVLEIEFVIEGIIREQN